MNTLNRIREIAFGVALVAGLAAGALQPREGNPRLPASRPALEMCAATKGALCNEQLADLGSLVHAPRGTAGETARQIAIVAELGRMTVTAPRERERIAATSAPIGYLGAIIVEAARAPAVTASVASSDAGTVSL